VNYCLYLVRLISPVTADSSVVGEKLAVTEVEVRCRLTVKKKGKVVV